MKRRRTNSFLAASTLVLSIASFLFVVQGASDEPYMTFRTWDAVIQVGVATVLMLLWAKIAVTVIAGVARHRISNWWSPLLLWILICEFSLFDSPYGYVADMMRYVVRPQSF